MITHQKDIHKLFARLRKRGLFAKEDWTCCQSCGLHAADQEAKAGQGIVFYHGQDAGLAFGGDAGKIISKRNRKELVENLWLSFAGDTYEQTRQIAEVVLEEASRVGVPAYWNGDIGTRIQILRKATVPKFIETNK